jgi:hypothetical protein
MEFEMKTVVLSFLAFVAVIPLAVGHVSTMKMPHMITSFRQHATLDATETNQTAFDRVSIRVDPFSVPNYRD